jgi:hypothetical protein
VTFNIPPQQSNELGSTRLLAGPNEKWDHKSAQEPLHRMLIPSRGICAYCSGTISRPVEEFFVQNFILRYPTDHPALSRKIIMSLLKC